MWCWCLHAQAFSDALRHELSPHGVSVSLLQPGTVRSAIMSSAQERAAETRRGAARREAEERSRVEEQDGTEAAAAGVPSMHTPSEVCVPACGGRGGELYKTSWPHNFPGIFVSHAYVVVVTCLTSVFRIIIVWFYKQNQAIAVPHSPTVPLCPSLCISLLLEPNLSPSLSLKPCPQRYPALFDQEHERFVERVMAKGDSPAVTTEVGVFAAYVSLLEVANTER